MKETNISKILFGFVPIDKHITPEKFYSKIATLRECSTAYIFV